MRKAWSKKLYTGGYLTMTQSQIEKAVDETLAPYGEVLDRFDLAKILKCTYQYVPVKLKNLKVPTIESIGKHNRITVAKPMLKQFLIATYSANGENYETPASK